MGAGELERAGDGAEAQRAAAVEAVARTLDVSAMLLQMAQGSLREVLGGDVESAQVVGMIERLYRWMMTRLPLARLVAESMLLGLTDEELSEVVAFFRSPVGEKATAHAQEVMARVAAREPPPVFICTPEERAELDAYQARVGHKVGASPDKDAWLEARMQAMFADHQGALMEALDAVVDEAIDATP